MASETTLGTRVKSFFTQSRLILNSLLLFAFFVIWIRDALYWFPKDAFSKSLNYWAYTDWLIDYSQGFIRRGLSGEIWRLVPDTVPPLEFVAIFSWALILIAAFGYLRMLVRSWRMHHPLTLFGLLFLPSLFVFYIHDHNAIGRKEILGYITVLLHLLVVEKSFPLREDFSHPNGNLRRYMGWLIPIAVIILPAIILIHEGSFLMFVPLHWMITLTILQMRFPRDFIRAAMWSTLMYLSTAIAVGAVYLAGTPSYQMLRGICEKWLTVNAIREGSCILLPEKLTGSTLPGSFIPMEWSLAIAGNITRIIISMNWVTWLLILPTLGTLLWYLVRQVVYSILRSRSSQSFTLQSAQRYLGVFFCKYFLTPFLLSLPVYFTAYDYGRWFTVTCINFSMVAVSMNLPCWEFALRKKESDDESSAVNLPEHLDNRLVFYGASITICILVLVLWLPHYCLFSCEIIRSPLEFFSHSFVAH